MEENNEQVSSGNYVPEKKDKKPNIFVRIWKEIVAIVKFIFG